MKIVEVILSIMGIIAIIACHITALGIAIGFILLLANVVTGMFVAKMIIAFILSYGLASLTAILIEAFDLV